MKFPSKPLCIGLGALLRLASASLLVSDVAHAQLAKLLAPVELQSGLVQSVDVGKELRPEDPKSEIPFTQEELLRELSASLSDHFALKGELELELVRSWAGVRLTGQPTLSILEYPQKGVSSQMSVRCRLSDNGHQVGEWLLPLRARLWQEVWVAASTLRNGQPLEISMVRRQKVDLLRYRSELLDADSDPSLYQTVQNVASGSVLSMRDVLEKPLIQKNQVVDAVLKRGALSITMKAQALENGAPRAFIKMRNIESRKEFNAQVIDERQVHVFF